MTDNDYLYPRPQDDAARVAHLHSCRILERPRQKSLALLTDLAAATFDVPIALVSLIDADTQWMRAIHGAEVLQMPRSTSFCTYVLMQVDVMVVEDAREDDRFAGNPLVVAQPMIRFYAGAPIYGPGEFKLGSFCLIDHLPRQGFTPRERKLLGRFAATASEILREDLHRAS